MRLQTSLLPLFSSLILSPLVASAGAAPAFAEKSPAALQVKAEIARLQQSRKENPITDKNWAEVFSSAGDDLRAATEALDADHLYLSMEKLAHAEDLLQATRRAVDQTAVEKGGLDAFQAEWGKVSVRLAALDKEEREHNWGVTPLAIRALAESADTKAVPLLEGGLGFATANGPKDGLMYVGEAEGEANFASLSWSLKFEGGKTPAFALRSMLPELHALQVKTNAAFQPPKSIDLHSRFIALNSTIKLAEELDAARFYTGALYVYLEAVRHYGMLEQRPLDADQKVQLARQLPMEWKRLASAEKDESIAQLFVERAESYTVHADGSAPSEDEWRSAQIIVDQVMPAYEAALKPATLVTKAGGKTVDITLVRWPYT
ncbi:MAG TPA: hypothetical protein VMI10_18275 [Terriglobales bacterium]|nr:hypothetical protein [Terriglobales bacterium]